MLVLLFFELGIVTLQQVTFDLTNNASIYSVNHSFTFYPINMLIAAWTHKLLIH